VLPSVKYARSALGGTFDRLHIGHKRLIAVAVALSDGIILGITSDEFAKSMRRASVQSLEERRTAVDDYLSQIGARDKVQVVVLEDTFGPALENKILEAIFVTVDTVENALKLNQARRQAGLRSLEVVIVPKVLAQAGGFVSSTRIRAGEIDADGRSIAELK
jgi:cytidyltransferase-like protein